MTPVHLLNKKSVFDHVYKEHWKALFLFAYRIVGDKETAEDIVQEIFVDLWIRMRKLEIGSYQAYLFQAVRNQCASRLRKKKMMPMETALLEEAIQMVDETEEQQIPQEQLLVEVQKKAQEILPEKCFDVFKLRFYEHMSVQDIANLRRISVSTVENHINKALKLLRSENIYDLHLLALITFYCF
ncbi:RNA polymerase sigma-70 factor [Sphingobacterium alkalisoli]|uniref:RNA polymerase sigma-70 factor n=1 Tax=Sphingobacterium alkalisoli TaxID=1874115 RepID=A0A4U0GUU4_9SPHI|nr:RNA polymerase sigma-70 factor [Sphingobacterium alkalisoli]TJY62767.1 RNA polymerase sigma-70 factor [Sphingobacterium alkalisoli]GGH28758.1 DNA-directed RNA polymerase sigma-70 factor [Sphingobacterium alkalisoli]